MSTEVEILPFLLTAIFFNMTSITGRLVQFKIIKALITVKTFSCHRHNSNSSFWFSTRTEAVWIRTILMQYRWKCLGTLQPIFHARFSTENQSLLRCTGNSKSHLGHGVYKRRCFIILQTGQHHWKSKFSLCNIKFKCEFPRADFIRTFSSLLI